MHWRKQLLNTVLISLAALLSSASGCGKKEDRPETKPAVKPQPRPAPTAPVSPYAEYEKIGLSPRPAKFYRKWE